MGKKAGKPIVRITQMDDDGYELVGDDIAEGESLAEAIDDYLANAKGDSQSLVRSFLVRDITGRVESKRFETKEAAEKWINYLLEQQPESRPVLEANKEIAGA